MTPLFESATLKLTLWYLLIVMVISLSFSAAIYKVGHDELAQGLHNQSARIYQTYPVFTNDPFFVHDTDLDVSSRHLLVNLAFLNLAVLVGAGFASYWLARRTLEPIAKAGEEQKRFVADASHELRTPVTALKMETEVALMDSAASRPELRKALESNLEEAGKLQELLDGLLKLSRLEDMRELQLTAQPLRPIIDDALERVRSTANAKHIVIHANDSGGLTVVAERDSLVQLLVILLDNAIKYSPAKSAIDIKAERHNDDIRLSVNDEGIGISAEALKHVFDRFYRADPSRTTDGYGLGLSIAKHITDLHHGTLTLTSTEGKGTNATITLPMNGRPAA